MSMRYPGGLIATSPVNARYPSGVWTQAQAIPYQAQNVWTRDQFWPYTTLLLQGDGAVNGAQNNTFLDSSSNNFTITRNGNTTQGSFTPYEQDGYWSNYFDGSSILTFASSTNYVPGSGQFCLECWFFPTTTSGDRWMIGNRNGNYVPFAINYQATTSPGSLVLYISSNGSSWDVANNAIVSGVSANQWNHFALIRNSSNQFIVYINGLGTTIATNAANFTSAQPFYVGGSPSAGDADFIGYISNVRFVKGDSVYSGNFIPSAAPLTAITNTQLLTSQGNRFIDRSTNAVTPTLTGSPSVQAFQPFPGATTWSASVLGGSGYFDGSGDYLDISHNANLTPSGDFTIEFWAYPTTGSGIREWYSKGSGIQVYSNGSSWSFAASSNNSGTYFISASFGTLVADAWQHIAVTRSGNSYVGFVNGVATTLGTSASAPGTGTSVVRLGEYSDNPIYPVVGYMAAVRFVNGTAVYGTSNFTPPTAPPTAVSNTQLLVNFTNAGIYDNSMMNDLETVGNAQVSTSVVKYGTGSMLFNGSSDYLVFPNNPAYDLGTGDFTIELFFYPTSLSGTRALVTRQIDPSSMAMQLRTNGTSLQFVSRSSDGSGLVTLSGGTVSLNTWSHAAVVKNGTAVTLYLNGTSVATATSSNNLSGAVALYVAVLNASGIQNYFSGYIDDLRITKGAARYIGNFTPPIARLPAQ